MKPNRQSSQRLTLEASTWVETLKRADAENHAQFVEWLKESPRNVREFLLMTAYDRELGGLDAAHTIDVQALLAGADRDVVALQDFTATAQKSSATARKHTGWLAAAAGVAALAVAGALLLSLQGSGYATTIGEQRVVELDDGSLLHLNTQSRVEVKFSQAGRDIELTAGEALFKVEKDARRPFRVHVEDAVIQAVGTEFNVYRRADATTVAVLEGAVKVSTGDRQAVLLKAGDEVQIAAGRLVKQTRVMTSEAAEWRRRRLVFRGEHLAVIAAEFNRYNKLKLEVQGEPPRRYTGVFDADDPASAIEVLNRDRDLIIERSAERIVIRPR